MFNPQMIMQMLPTLQNNPIGMLLNKGYNIPNGQQYNNPQAIIEYLMNSGQIDQNTYNNAIKTAQQMGYKL